MREEAGSITWKNGRAAVRLSLGAPYGRRSFALAPSITSEDAAEERRALMASLARRLRSAGRIVGAVELLERLAGAEGARETKTISAAIEALLAGDAPTLPAAGETFGALAERWTSGELAKLYPDHIKDVKHETNVYRLEKYVLPILRDIPIAAFEGPAGLNYAQEVMRRLPSSLAPASRRQVAQILHRILSIAVFPLRLLVAQPLPRGFLPSPGKEKAKACLYPDEDRKLLACAAVPLVDRMLYGFLHREGMRSEEAERLERSDLDLKRGAIALDKNKTSDPRAWALRPDTVRALRAWFALRDARGDRDSRAFPRTFSNAAEKFRAHLEAAGVERPQLFERSAERLRIRFHDTRATFITIALANNRTEAWIADRTGHRSSGQINRYRRAARTVAELGLGDLGPLDVLVPELGAAAPQGSAQGGPGEPASGSGEQGGPAPSPANGSRLAPDGARGREETRGDHEIPTIEAPRDTSQPPETIVVPVVAGSIPVAHPKSESPGVTGTSANPEGEQSAALERTGYQMATNRTDAGGPTAAPLEGSQRAAGGRPDVIAQLAGMLATFAAAGDLEGARTMHEAIGRLLGPAASTHAGAAVVDLAAERARRGER